MTKIGEDRVMPLIAGQVIAYRGRDEELAELVFDYTDEDGMEWGHIVLRGRAYPPKLLLQLLVRGYWRASKT